MFKNPCPELGLAAGLSPIIYGSLNCVFSVFLEQHEPDLILQGCLHRHGRLVISAFITESRVSGPIYPHSRIFSKNAKICKLLLSGLSIFLLPALSSETNWPIAASHTSMTMTWFMQLCLRVSLARLNSRRHVSSSDATKTPLSSFPPFAQANE